MLTCRIPGYRAAPTVRIVVDSHLRTRLTAKLVSTAAADPTWIVHRNGVPADRRRAFADAGVRLIDAGGGERGVDLPHAMQLLGAAGLTRVLVEGGAKLAGRAAARRAGGPDRLVPRTRDRRRRRGGRLRRRSASSGSPICRDSYAPARASWGTTC